MGILPASLGAVSIYQALIVDAQEGTRSGTQHVVTVWVSKKVFVYELAALHPKCFGEPVNVGLDENRAGGLAAVGTV